MSVSTVNLVPIREEAASLLARIDALLGLQSTSGAVTGSSKTKAVKVKKTKAEKKPSKRAGLPTVLGDYTKSLLLAHPEELKAFKDANPDRKGAHLVFVSEYRKSHPEEWKEFETTWKLAHPKVDTVAADTGSVSGDSAVASVAEDSTTPEKPKRVVSDEQKAKMKAGREAAKAKRDAEKAAGETVAKDETAPVAAEEKKAKKEVKKAKKAEPAPVVEAPVVEAPVAAEEEDGAEFIPFQLDKAKFLRLGSRRPDGSVIWETGDLWESNKGARGDYVGCLSEDGSIDASAEEPETE